MGTTFIMMFIYQPVLLLLTTVATLGKGVNGHTPTTSHTKNLRHRSMVSVNRAPTTTTTMNIEDKESYRNQDVPLVSILSSV